ncbi:endonuclease/exonuclease/phosphatase family protein [Parachitinimonas caeni]|uniref:Endonuclease/exonuclease/phosphatase family protein n=1 Tax=Parachitinimonas caeni TaxID=3031301 RepID=A0ABT7DZE8_9NEIS|nr:endonuclease/exonuclease/phosphatase family protein [Parachitinimonas caeni]MDK2124448.1 endonuclease/exonuclease/phosphatase family protein [Parachitinimonas caeni]
MISSHKDSLTVATYNIHKGMSPFNRRITLHELKAALVALDADLVFLQEVQGEHRLRAARWDHWPDQPQHEFLGNGLSHNHAYGRNAVYRWGHHGNALLSLYPILTVKNHDITLNRFEQRGLLHCEIEIPHWPQPLHAVCVHLNLLAGDRRKQMANLVARVRTLVPPEAPLIIAGDFNDWGREACRFLGDTIGVVDAFHCKHGRVAASFPARLPLLPLDRIYVRGLNVRHAQALHGAPWDRLSDHTPLSATLSLE